MNISDRVHRVLHFIYINMNYSENYRERDITSYTCVCVSKQRSMKWLHESGNTFVLMDQLRMNLDSIVMQSDMEKNGHVLRESTAYLAFELQIQMCRLKSHARRLAFRWRQTTLPNTESERLHRILSLFLSSLSIEKSNWLALSKWLFISYLANCRTERIFNLKI